MLKEESTIPKFEENEWSISPENVYICGRMTKDNLEALEEMSDKTERNQNKICLPGVSIVYFKAQDAEQLFLQEHQSRDTLMNVTFRLILDTEKGQQKYPPDSNHWGTLNTCFNLEKLMNNNAEYTGQGLISRFVGKIETYTIEKDTRNDL